MFVTIRSSCGQAGSAKALTTRRKLDGGTTMKTHWARARRSTSAAGLAGFIGLSLAGCTTAELEAISAGLSQGLAEASYSQPYATSYYGNGYAASPYTVAYDQWVGYDDCAHIGSFYKCDTNGDGYADMFGDTEDGSYTSSSLKVNGRGEAYTWGENGWERNRAYDGPRQPDEVIITHRNDD